MCTPLRTSDDRQVQTLAGQADRIGKERGLNDKLYGGGSYQQVIRRG
jgi:hypothetical protein